MEKLDVVQPIKTIMHGSNYVIWSQEMSSFLKGRWLWRYATGEITNPIKQKNEDETKFYEWLEEWDSKNHQILTWIRNTTITSIKLQFGRFETAQEVWDLLCNRYSITDIAHQYQLFEKLSPMKQSSGQSINDFLSHMHIVWDHLALSKPQWESHKDAEKFFVYHDNMRVMQFLMALHTDYEPIRASLLHREKFPKLEMLLLNFYPKRHDLAFLKLINQKLCCQMLSWQLPSLLINSASIADD